MEDEKLIIEPRKYGGDSKVISMRIPEELVCAIDDVAREVGRSRNDLLTLCLEYAIDHMQIKK